ncbi:MAG TPA: glycerophosphodiester phosphodiesterase family protein [Rhabdochlamydiaceae bacterium]|jgi:glycerophosphoryl diester phosphodiesterase
MRYLVLFFLMPLFIWTQQIEVQGHRGARGVRPENTLPSFAAAIEAGADALEMDLLLTKEGEIVIYHDENINSQLIAYLDGSPVSSSPLVHELSLQQIKQFDCGRLVNPAFPMQKQMPGTQIPTLEELFVFLKTSSLPHAKDIRLNLEIKRNPFFPQITAPCEEIVKKLLATVKAHGMSSRVSYSSFDPEVLYVLRKHAPNATIAFLREASLTGMVDIAKSLKAKTVSPDHELIHSAQDIRNLQQLGFRVVLWTVNEPQRWKELIEWGVDGIITDYPEELVRFLKN